MHSIERVDTTPNPFSWNGAYGYEWLPETGLYRVGAREYDSRTARWLQRDPIDIGGEHPNLYFYCQNDPINCADPYGLAPSRCRPCSVRGRPPLSEWGHALLDLFGFIPGVGEVADFANAAWYAAEGDLPNAAISAAGGAIPLLGDAGKASRLASKIPRLLRPAPECLKYTVGQYKQLKKLAKNSGLDAHHVPQRHPAKQIIKGYDEDTAPAILIPQEMHTDINKSNIKGIYTGTPLDLVMNGIKELYEQGVPLEAIINLLEEIRQTYPGIFR